ncbi:MAG TPA: NAD(P)/FAD-dependent oxidoreductase, partial [Nevskia sp.]|nr:NAD(P)/FAD-dependent oxidoreductase [Nevskia sp.]
MGADGSMGAAQQHSPRVVIIGSGFGGLSMGYSLKQAGIDSFTILEKARDVGGVWRENTYPGAACDVPSHLYSFSFEPHYPWSCRYGKQGEILDYLRHVARKQDLLRHVRFGCEVLGADWDEARALWRIRLRGGELIEAEMLVSAVGQLHQPEIPQLPGLEKFRGRTFHSARWDHDFDFKGKTVAVVGTGPSAVQLVPEIAKEVKSLHLYQRSPGWCVPKFDRPYRRWERRLIERVPLLHDIDRIRIFWTFEWLNSALLRKPVLGHAAKAFLRGGAEVLKRLQVRSPELRAKLTPDYPMGCKRTLLSNDWLKTLAQPHVEVVTEGVAEVTASGIRTSDGKLREVDAIVWGTGFASTEFLAPMEIRGRGGRSLRERWKNGAEAFLGMAVSGFPNLFVVYGPNTNLGAGSIVFMLERQTRYIAKAAALLRQQGPAALEVRVDVQHAFNAMLQKRNKQTVFEAGCHSWYLTADGRNTNTWVGTMSEYGRLVRQPDLAHYHLEPVART